MLDQQLDLHAPRPAGPAAAQRDRRAEDAIRTSALATADFLADQRPGGTAYVVGEAGLTTAMHDVGYVMSDRDPDYVVLGETRTYSFEAITKAIRLIMGGAGFIATNPDRAGRARRPLPPLGRSPAPISTRNGQQPTIGKPNPLMMRSALDRLEAHLGDDGDGRRPDGHRHHQRARGGLRTVLVSPARPGRSRSSTSLTGRPGRRLDRRPGPLVSELAAEGVQ